MGGKVSKAIEWRIAYRIYRYLVIIRRQHKPLPSPQSLESSIEGHHHIRILASPPHRRIRPLVEISQEPHFYRRLGERFVDQFDCYDGPIVCGRSEIFGEDRKGRDGSVEIGAVSEPFSGGAKAAAPFSDFISKKAISSATVWKRSWRSRADVRVVESIL